MLRPDVDVLRLSYQMSASSSEKIGCKYSSSKKYNAENSQPGNRNYQERIVPASGFFDFVFLCRRSVLEQRFLPRCLHG